MIIEYFTISLEHLRQVNDFRIFHDLLRCKRQVIDIRILHNYVDKSLIF